MDVDDIEDEIWDKDGYYLPVKEELREELKKPGHLSNEICSCSHSLSSHNWNKSKEYGPAYCMACSCTKYEFRKWDRTIPFILKPLIRKECYYLTSPRYGRSRYYSGSVIPANFVGNGWWLRVRYGNRTIVSQSPIQTESVVNWMCNKAYIQPSAFRWVSMFSPPYKQRPWKFDEPDDRLLTQNRDNGLIYFIQSGESGPVKIGWTSSISSRMDAIQSYNAFPLRLLWAKLGSQKEETKYHEKLNSIRLHGEWFRSEKLLFDFIKSQMKKDVKRREEILKRNRKYFSSSLICNSKAVYLAPLSELQFWITAEEKSREVEGDDWGD